MLATHSPLLDFRGISAASQFARVEAGTLDLREFDFYYARMHLARPAHLKMQALARSLEESDPELARAIRKPKRSGAEEARARRDFWERVVYRPEPFDVPEGLRAAVESHWWVSTIRGRGTSAAFVRVDLNDDGESEYVLIEDVGRKSRSGYMFHWDGQEWRTAFLRERKSEPGQPAATFDIRLDPIGTAEPRFRDLTIGEVTFAVSL